MSSRKLHGGCSAVWIRLSLELLVIGVLCCPRSGRAFVQEGNGSTLFFWPDAQTSLNLRLECPPTPLINWGPCWDHAAADAATRWDNAGSRFRFSTQSPSLSTDSCVHSDGLHTSSFRTNLCGRSFGDALAVTFLVFDSATGGLLDTDVAFDGNRQWSTYPGPLQRNAFGVTVYDFHRVAIHEYGHVLGLDHPDDFGQTVPAIMNSRVSDLDDLQVDDVAGINAIYPAIFTHWTPVPLGGATAAGPAAAIYNGELSLIVRGTDNAIYYTRMNSGVWTGWTPLGGVTLSEPTAVAFNGELWVFVRGTTDRVYVNRFNGVSWSGWSEVPGGGLTPSGPAAAVLNNEIYLFVRGTTNRLYLNRLTAGGWTGWSEVPGGGLTPDAPAVMVAQSTVRVVVRGMDNHIYDSLFGLFFGWTGWAEVPGGGLTLSAPAVTFFKDQIWYFVRGTDNRLYRNFLPLGLGGNWSGWGEVAGGGLSPSPPGAAATSTMLYLVVKGTDSEIYLNQAP
jgi:hypothetical protein